MIIATLLVMVATVYILFDYQRSNREDLARAQGLELVRLLGGLSWPELVPQTGTKGLLAVLQQGQSNPDFAYGAVVDIGGAVATEVTRSGVIVPPGDIVNEPTSWLGQRVLPENDADSRVEFIESYAPVFDAGVHKGFVRLGYLRPGFGISYSEMPFLASVMLPIFLLVPFFYFMLRREIKPLKDISQRFEELADQGGVDQIAMPPSQALNDFMEQVSGYIDATQTKLEVLNQEHEDLTMSSKLLTYKSNRVEAILQNFPDAVMVIDEAGEVSYANGKTERLLGVEASALLGKKTREWCNNPEIVPLLTFSDVKSNLQANQDTVQVLSLILI
mgnify:FL=1